MKIFYNLKREFGLLGDRDIQNVLKLLNLLLFEEKMLKENFIYIFKHQNIIV